MKRYLSTLHRQPDEHKRRFALFVSSVVTLFIFSIWSLVIFGTSPGGILAENETNQVAETTSGDISPFQSMRSGLASSFQALKNSFGELKSGIESVNLETKYQDLRDGALDIYAR